jgi:hypothetical protein
MSATNPQKTTTSKYEHRSSAINKNVAGSETGNTIPDCKSMLSTLSLTNRILTKSYKLTLKLKPHVPTSQVYNQGIDSISEMNQNYPKLLQLQQTRTSHKPQTSILQILNKNTNQYTKT